MIDKPHKLIRLPLVASLSVVFSAVLCVPFSVFCEEPQREVQPQANDYQRVEVILQDAWSIPLRRLPVAVLHTDDDSTSKTQLLALRIVHTNDQGLAEAMLPQGVFTLLPLTNDYFIRPIDSIRFSTPQAGSLTLLQLLHKQRDQKRQPQKRSEVANEQIRRSFPELLRYTTEQQFLQWQNRVALQRAYALAMDDHPTTAPLALPAQNPALSRVYALAHLQFPFDAEVKITSDDASVTTQTLPLILVDPQGAALEEALVTLITTTATGVVDHETQLLKVGNGVEFSRGAPVFRISVPTEGFARLYVQSPKEAISKGDLNFGGRISTLSPVFSLNPMDNEFPTQLTLVNPDEQLQGHVLGPNEFPLANATVEALSSEGVLLQAVTNRQGYFTLWPMKQRPTILRVTSTVEAISPVDTIVYVRRLFLEFSPHSEDILIPYAYLPHDEITGIQENPLTSAP